MKITFPPHDVAIPIGEALYQMRSALDHLAFGLVKASNPILPLDWERNCEFPLKLQLPKTVPCAPVPFGHDSFSKCLPGIPIGPFTIIESLQPYYPFGAAKLPVAVKTSRLQSIVQQLFSKSPFSN